MQKLKMFQWGRLTLKTGGNVVLWIAGGVAASQCGMATPLCVNGTTMNQMTGANAGFACQYDGLVFSGFSYQYSDRGSAGNFSTPGTNNVTASQVQVTWETDSNGVLSVDFSTTSGTGGWAVGAGDNTDINLGYEVTTPSPAGLNSYLIAGAGLQTEGTVSNNVPAGTSNSQRVDGLDQSKINVVETATPNTGSSVSPVTGLSVAQNHTGNVYSTLTASNAGNMSGAVCPMSGACLDSLTPTTGIVENKDVAIQGGKNLNGGYTNSADLLEIWEPIYEVQSQVPEPVGLALTGFGLIGLSLLGRKRKVSKS